MGWCPKCRNEYVKRLTHCPKCEVRLVEGLAEETHSENLVKQEIERRAAAKMQWDALSEEEQKIAYKEALLRAEKVKQEQKNPSYLNSNEKAQEMKSSAITLLIVGLLGMAFIVLVFANVIPVKLSVVGKSIFCGGMGVLSLCLLITGALSLKSFKLLKETATDEDNRTAEIQKWYRANLSRDIIEEGLFEGEEEDTAEELKYFQRIEKIAKLLHSKFMNLDAAYADRIIEDIYQEFYE